MQQPHTTQPGAVPPGPAVAIDLHAGYRSTATDTDPRALIRFLDIVYDDPAMQAYKLRMRRLLALRPGETVLEVGCGAGHDLIRDARQVGPGGRVIGVDAKASMVAEAQRRVLADCGPARRVAALGPLARTVPIHRMISCHLGDARNLPLGDATVDACRVDRVLMYVPTPERALAEMVRVLRPGGRLVAMELDYGALLIDHPDTAMTERVLAALRAAIPNDLLGRSLRRILGDLGLSDVTVTPHGIELTHDLFRQVIEPTLASAAATGQLPRSQTRQWLAEMTSSHRAGRFYGTFIGMVAFARKPLRDRLGSAVVMPWPPAAKDKKY
jgi:ubiquinone/menaquinone biosynthesis C-methylase UbiE